MARKRQRRYFPARRTTGRGRPDTSERQGQIDTLAQQLASQHTSDELQRLLAERTALLEEADRAAPTTLARAAWRVTTPPARPGRSPRVPSSWAVPRVLSPTTTSAPPLVCCAALPPLLPQAGGNALFSA